MIYSKETLDRISAILIRNGQTLAVAESVTAGHLQAAFSNATDAACFFQGGITTYNLGQKCRQLQVDPITAQRHNSVSASITEQMAKQVCELFLSDYGIAVTGYATPVPEKGIEKLFAHICISKHGEVLLAEQIVPENAKAFDAQVSFTNQILEAFAQKIA